MKLEELKELEGKATKGPWEKYGGEGHAEADFNIYREGQEDGGRGVAYAVANPFDADLIVAMRNSFGALLEVAEAAAQVDETYNKPSERLRQALTNLNNVLEGEEKVVDNDGA